MGAAERDAGALLDAVELARAPAFARRMVPLLAQPFAVHMLDDERRGRRLEVATLADFRGLCAAAFGEMEPYVPWERDILTQRRKCYAAVGSPRLKVAEAELRAFLSAEAVPFELGLTEGP